MALYKKSKRKTKDSDTCCSSVSLIKSMLHIFNIVFMLSGAAILGVAIWTIFWRFQYGALLTTNVYSVGIWAFAFTGAIAFFGGILGCFGLFLEHRALILGYTFLLVLVFLLEAIIGGLSYVYETHVEEELQMTLNHTFLTNYGVNERETNAIDRMQQEYSCCGAIRFEDWRLSVWYTNKWTNLLRPSTDRLVPDSCCISVQEFCGKSDHPSNIPYTGCIYKMSEELREQLTIIGAVGLGICLINVIGIILAFCLYIRLKDPDD